MNFFRYKNLQILLLSIVFAILISRNESFHQWLLSFGEYGYISAFIGGILFVSTFTFATGTVILLILAEQLSILSIGVIAGLGAVIGDFVIFKFVRDGLTSELTKLYDGVDRKHHLRKIFHTKYFGWVLPVVGAIIIASPFPDEIGVSLMGIAKMKTYKFIVVSFLLNTTGILCILYTIYLI